MPTLRELLEQQAATADPPGEEISFTEGFGRSVASSFTELLGVQPSVEVENFRAERPVAGALSQFTGLLIPYVGYARVAQGIKPIARLRERAGKAVGEDRAFASGVAKEIATFLPFEAGRVGAGALVGAELAEAMDRPFAGTGELSSEAAFALGIGGLAGGVVGKLGEAGPRLLKRLTTSGQDLFATPQGRVAKLMEEAAAPGASDTVRAALGRARQAVYGQVPAAVRHETATGRTATKVQRFVSDLEDLDIKATNRLNNLMRGASTSRFEKGRFFVNARGPFRTVAERDAKLAELGLRGSEDVIQFPRFVRAKNERGQRQINEALQSLKTLDATRGWYFARDRADGLFLMAKSSPDGLTLFKTSDPGRFVPEIGRFANQMRARAATFGLGTGQVDPLELGLGTRAYDAIARFRQQPLIDTRGLDPRKGGIKQITERIGRVTGLENVQGGEGAAALNRFLRSTLTPAMFQFRSNPLAANIRAASVIGKEAAEEVAERLYLGKELGTKAKSPLGTIVAQTVRPAENSVDQLIDEVFKSPIEAAKFQRAVIQGLSPEQAIDDLGAGKAVEDLLRELNRIDQIQVQGLQAVQSAVGERLIRARPFHYGLSRFWQGDWRVPIREGRRPVGFASGTTRRAAMQQAQRLVEQGQLEGFTWRAGAPQLSKAVEDEVKLVRGIHETDAKNFGRVLDRVQISTAPPKTVRERKGLRGFEGDLPEDLWERSFVKERVLAQLRSYQSLQARLAMDHIYSKELVKLASEDPDIAVEVAKRVSQAFGQQGPITKAINDAADKALGPYLGANSASKIVAGLNEAMFHLTFGFLNTGFNMANLLTFMQTSYPHLSFLTTAAPARVAEYYTYWPVLGNRTANGLGVLDMFKLTAKSFGRMGAQSDDELMELVRRAAAEGVTSPRFVEEWVGKNAVGLRTFQGALAGENGFAEALRMTSKALPTLTERFARTHSFVLGDTFFKDVMGITDKELRYQLAKQFTEKTQFLYGTEDRANIFTGPLGGAMGLFKNWTMHYLHWMLEYLGEGALRGNWRPLLWSIGGTTSIGGVAALPFWGAADVLAEEFSDESTLLHTFQMFQGVTGSAEADKQIADTVYYGLPALFGLSVQSQVAAPFADPGQDASRLFSLAYADRAKFIGRFAGQAVDFWSTTGENPVNDPRTRDLFIRAFLPKSIYQATEAIKDDVLNSYSTGLPQQRLSLYDRIAYGAGTSSAEMARNFDAARELWADQGAMRRTVTRFGKQLAAAWEENDRRGASIIMTRASHQGVDLSRVVRSAKTQLAQGQETLIERQFAPEAVFAYKRAGIVQ